VRPQLLDLLGVPRSAEKTKERGYIAVDRQAAMQLREDAVSSASQTEGVLADES